MLENTSLGRWKNIFHNVVKIPLKYPSWTCNLISYLKISTDKLHVNLKNAKCIIRGCYTELQTQWFISCSDTHIQWK